MGITAAKMPFSPSPVVAGSAAEDDDDAAGDAAVGEDEGELLRYASGASFPSSSKTTTCGVNPAKALGW